MTQKTKKSPAKKAKVAAKKSAAITKTTKTKPAAKKAVAKKAVAKKPVAKKPVAKAKQEAPVAATPKSKQTPAQKEIAEKIQKVLETPLKVFIKKDITGTSKNIGPGSSVILEKLSVIGPTGSHVFRVKRQNCDRTYYTVEENIPQ